MKARYERVLLKMSGEALLGDEGYGIGPGMLKAVARDLIELTEIAVQVALVIGGGNIFRGTGLAASGMERVTADQIGMLATVMNALALQDTLENQGAYARVMSAIRINELCEDYLLRRAIRHLEKGRIVIFAAGTGNPFFTTDTAAALRANEMSCDALLKGTQVDGVYSADPKVDPQATRFDELTYLNVLSQDLRVMDASAISLARENNIPILVFSLHNPGAFADVVTGNGRFTVIRAGEH
jgi:uridylate kinase